MPANFDLLIFDLDGTLFETREDLASSVNYALGKEGFEELPLETIVQFVGDGAAKLIQRSLGDRATDLLCKGVLDTFLEHYADHCTGATRAYPGVAEIIPALNSQALAILTNKPSGPTESILEASGLQQYFKQVIGGDTAHGRKPDPAGIFSIMGELGFDPSRVLLVGDTSVDVKTARNANCRCAGVKYGFRPGDFDKDPPDYLLNEFKDILAILEDGAKLDNGS
jgi:phosphoglycolate phosphatase